jgi:hypothetical protein
VLNRTHGDYIIIWRYRDESDCPQRHATAWLAAERRLIDDRPAVLDIPRTERGVGKKEARKVRESLFPTGHQIEIDALYEVRAH